MNTIVTRNLSIVLAVSFAALCLSTASAQRESDSGEAKRGAWQPDPQDRSAYRDIVDLNIFLADRRGLAKKVERERNPLPVKDPKVEVIETKEADSPPPPPNPDTLWRLTGIGRDQDGATAFIEHMETGELSRVTKPMDFSIGEITTIGYDAIIYVVEDEERMIRVGESLVGQPVVLAEEKTDTRDTTDGTTEPATSTAAEPAADGAAQPTTGTTISGSAADRLRLLRERREREQGNGP